MNNNVFGNDFNAFSYDFGIFINVKRFNFTVVIFFFKVGAFDYVKKLKLDAVSNLADVCNAFKHILSAFIGQTDNKVGYNVNSYIMQVLNCLIVNAKGIAAPYILRRFFVDCLQSEFNENGLDFVNFIKQFQNFFAKAIGTRCN